MSNEQTMTPQQALQNLDALRQHDSVVLNFKTTVLMAQSVEVLKAAIAKPDVETGQPSEGGEPVVSGEVEEDVKATGNHKGRKPRRRKKPGEAEEADRE